MKPSSGFTAMIHRDQVRRDLRAGLLPVREIARRAGCSVRTVYRIEAERERPARAPETENTLSALSALIKETEAYYENKSF